MTCCGGGGGGGGGANGLGGCLKARSNVFEARSFAKVSQLCMREQWRFISGLQQYLLGILQPILGSAERPVIGGQERSLQQAPNAGKVLVAKPRQLLVIGTRGSHRSAEGTRNRPVNSLPPFGVPLLQLLQPGDASRPAPPGSRGRLVVSVSVTQLARRSVLALCCVCSPS